MTNISWRTRRDTGFSLVEMLMTLGVLSVVSSMALMEVGALRPALKSDGAMRVVMAQLSTARELSISQRRNMQVDFVGPNVVQVVRHEMPLGTTVLATVPFEGGVGYGTVADTPDTPDGFGRHGTVAVDFGSATTVMFSPEGMLMDGNGNPVNGTIYLTIPNQPGSFRAVTILGATGRIRAYRWDSLHWVLV